MSTQGKVICGICDAQIHKNSIQKHQKSHNLTSAEDRATVRFWETIKREGQQKESQVSWQMLRLSMWQKFEES